MYVEDESDKTIRLAKRKAYGPCDLHQGHFNWLEYWLGIITVVAIGLIGGMIIFSPDKALITRSTVQYSCTTTDPKTGNVTGYSGYLNTSSAFTVDANTNCIFSN